MELKAKWDYFIVPKSRAWDLPFIDSRWDGWETSGDGRHMEILRVPSVADKVEIIRGMLAVYHTKFYHIEAKDNSSFLLYSGLVDTDSGIYTQYLGRAKIRKDSIQILPGTVITWGRA